VGVAHPRYITWEDMTLRTHTYTRLAAGVLMALVVACTSDDEEPAAIESTVAPAPATAAAQATAQAPQTVIVKSGERGGEYFFEPKDLSVAAGKLTVTLDNSGPERPHTWAVKSKTGEGDVARVERTPVGSTGTAEFTLTEAGTYEIYCTLPGHADRGQRGTLTVSGSGA
jgi:plastocyanin